MEYRAATWRTRRLAAEPCPLWSIGPFAINVLPLKAQVKDRVTRSPTPHHPLKFEITFCVRGVFGTPLGNPVLCAGIFQMSQCVHVPTGASGSSAINANDWTPAGAPNHDKSGEASAPSQV